MNKILFFDALFKFLLGVLLVGLLIFLPANTLNYPNGILLMILLFVPMFVVGIIMMIKNPELLKRRLDGKEKIKSQDHLIKLSALMFLVGFVLAGFSYRYKLLLMPKSITIIASFTFLFAYLLWAIVLKQNAYLSRTIKVEEGQTVVDTGLYGIIRHPMYTASILLFISMPLILGSWLSFICFLFYPLIIIARLKNEEAYLEKELPGYKAYKQKVKYRLIPFIY